MVHDVCVCESVTSALLILVCKFAYTHRWLGIYTHGGRIIMFVFTLNCYTRRIQSILYVYIYVCMYIVYVPSSCGGAYLLYKYIIPYTWLLVRYGRAANGTVGGRSCCCCCCTRVAFYNLSVSSERTYF